MNRINGVLNVTTAHNTQKLNVFRLRDLQQFSPDLLGISIFLNLYLFK